MLTLSYEPQTPDTDTATATMGVILHRVYGEEQRVDSKEIESLLKSGKYKKISLDFMTSPQIIPFKRKQTKRTKIEIQEAAALAYHRPRTKARMLVKSNAKKIEKNDKDVGRLLSDFIIYDSYETTAVKNQRYHHQHQQWGTVK